MGLGKIIIIIIIIIIFLFLTKKIYEIVFSMS